MIVNALKTVWQLKHALSTSYWPIEKLRQRQEGLLRQLLVHAYCNVPLYRRLYDETGFRPKDFQTWEDIRKIPVLSKAWLKKGAPGEVVASGIDPRGCKVVMTSGSTGTPLRIYLSPEDERWQRVTAWRILFEHGYRWTFRTLQIDTTPSQSYFLQRLGIAPKDWMSTSDSPEQWIAALKSRRYEVLVGTASVLHAMAERILSDGLKVAPPKILISDDETLTSTTRDLVQHAFGIEPIDVYGLCELSNFVWQCETRNGYHISADSHIVEVTAPPGQIGSVIATALGMVTMPIIRYETGDLAETTPERCVCGRTLPVLTRILGRAVDSVELPDRRKLLWPFFYDLFSRYDELLQWRVVQSDPLHLRVELVVPHDDVALMKHIALHLRKALPRQMELKLERVAAIPVSPGGKARMVISMIGSGIER